MEDIKWINDLKLRVGYGVTGNQEIGNYKSLQLLEKIDFFIIRKIGLVRINLLVIPILI